MNEPLTIIDSQTQINIENWLKSNIGGKEAIQKLQKENPTELFNAFYQNLSFGTGGLRGIMGIGTNRFNLYTIRIATQGLAGYILQQPKSRNHHRVFIGFDCRHQSKEFAEEAAKILAANDIECYLYKDLRPVANISFGLRYKECIAGIMITASHNPPQYNGYKIYWSYGGQLLPPHEEAIYAEMHRIRDASKIRSASLPHSLIHHVDEEIDRAYLEQMQKYRLHDAVNQKQGDQLKIVYTNLHGSGITMVPRILNHWGFTKLSCVEKQMVPDGNFPTIQNPNPEDPETMAMGVEKLQAVQGDILLGTDPDTDRLGVIVMHDGKPFFFDGHQIACLLLEHRCRSLKNSAKLPPKPACIKTIVTTELFRKIATYYGIACFDVLTGFKYVGEKIDQWERSEKEQSYDFLFGAEESFGYLIGTDVRDKDAMCAAASICEAALQMKLKGKTLVDQMFAIYSSYGIHREKLYTFSFEGRDGHEKIESIMELLRAHPPQKIGEMPIEKVEDFWLKTAFSVNFQKTECLNLPQSNVIRFWLTDQTKIVVRPSGTEPKIKIYGGAIGCCPPNASDETLQKSIHLCDKQLENTLLIFLSYLGL